MFPYTHKNVQTDGSGDAQSAHTVAEKL